MESKTEIKYCKACGKKIKLLDKGVTWITFDNGKDTETIHWHWQCFIDWRNKSMENRATKLYIDTMNKIMPGAEKMVSRMVRDAQIQVSS